MAGEFVEHRTPAGSSYNHVSVADVSVAAYPRVAVFSCLYVVCCGGERSILNTPVQFVPLQQIPPGPSCVKFAFQRTHYIVVRKVLSPIFVRLVLFVLDLKWCPGGVRRSADAL
jgi:hypothetical protein